jgi:hypothetical protein
MKISRSLFLAMTGAIAAGACHVYVDEPPPSPPPPPPRVVYRYPPAPPPGYTAEVSYNAPYYYGARPPPPRVVRRPRRAVGVATADPGYRPAPPSLGLTSPPNPSAESGGAVAPPATSTPPSSLVPPTPPTAATEGCLDAEAMPVPDCSEVKVDPTCGIRSFVMQRCATYRNLLDPKVATVAIGCMASLSPTQLCDATNTYDCGKQALAQACADTGLASMCQIAATSCKTTENDCTALLSGLSDTGKQKVAECVSHGCKAGLYSCVEGLR